jgi:hypothetical protein
MKLLIALFWIVGSIDCFGQLQRNGLFIPKDDGSPFTWDTKHMWVGQRNIVASTGIDDLVEVWGDSAEVDSIDKSHCAIIPLAVGPIYLHSLHSVRSSSNTVAKTDTFHAIVRPMMRIKVVKDDFKKDSTIEFVIIDETTSKPVDNRYEVGRMYEPFVLNPNDSVKGRLDHCYGTTIDFKKNKSGYNVDAQSGDKIQLRIWIRDRQTDLLLPAKELVYTLK